MPRAPLLEGATPPFDARMEATGGKRTLAPRGTWLTINTSKARCNLILPRPGYPGTRRCTFTSRNGCCFVPHVRKLWGPLSHVWLQCWGKGRCIEPGVHAWPLAPASKRRSVSVAPATALHCGFLRPAVTVGGVAVFEWLACSALPRPSARFASQHNYPLNLTPCLILALPVCPGLCSLCGPHSALPPCEGAL